MAKETLSKARYMHYAYLGTGEHILLNLATSEFEVWVANKNHASYGLIYKNTHLEFVRGLGKASGIKLNGKSRTVEMKFGKEVMTGKFKPPVPLAFEFIS